MNHHFPPEMSFYFVLFCFWSAAPKRRLEIVIECKFMRRINLRLVRPVRGLKILCGLDRRNKAPEMFQNVASYGAIDPGNIAIPSV